MANLSNLNNKFIVTDGGNALINATANLTTYGGLTIDNISNPSIAMKTSSASGWIYTQYITSSGTNNFSMGVNQSVPYWGVGAGAGMGGSNMDLVVNSSGNVGIGTFSPGSKLDIGTSSGASMQFLYDTSQTYRNNISNYWNSSTDSRMDFNIGRTANVAPVTIMSVGYAGNVGIGTISPSYKLDVSGNTRSSTVTVYDGMGGTETGIGASSAGGYLRLYSAGVNRVTVESTGRTLSVYGLDTVGSNFIQFFNSAGTAQGYIGMGAGGTNDFIISCESSSVPIRFFNGGGEKMRIESGGNVGIGTTAPETKLEVAGSIASGTATAPTQLTYNGNLIKGFVHNFTKSKNANTGTAVNATLVDISGIGNFHQAMFYIQYGTRLQSVSDNVTGVVVRAYGVNRFNGGTLQVTETSAIAGSSNSLTHALVNVEIVSNTQYRLRIEFSSTIGGSSFATGLINGFGVGDYFPTITFAEGTAG